MHMEISQIMTLEKNRYLYCHALKNKNKKHLCLTFKGPVCKIWHFLMPHFDLITLIIVVGSNHKTPSRL